MKETVFWMQCKNQEICEIGNRKQSAIPYSAVVLPRYSILFYSSTCSMNQMQVEVKPCKAEIRKGKKKSCVRSHYAELKSGRNNELEGKCVYNPEWERNPA